MNSYDEENFEENTVIETSDLKGIFPDGANITNCEYIKDIDAFHCKDWYSPTLELDLQDSSLNGWIISQAPSNWRSFCVGGRFLVRGWKTLTYPLKSSIYTLSSAPIDIISLFVSVLLNVQIVLKSLRKTEYKS